MAKKRAPTWQPNVVSDYDPNAEYDREVEGRPRPDGSHVASDYDPIARLEREPGSRRTAASPSKEPTSAPAPSEKRQRAARKSVLIKKSIAGYFPKGIPETLPNPELVQQIMKWLADYCKENEMPLPAISPTQVPRVSGRKK
jgi:hypothetical protein